MPDYWGLRPANDDETIADTVALQLGAGKLRLSGSPERIAVVPRSSSVTAGEGEFRLGPRTPLYLRAADSLPCAVAAFDELANALFGTSLPSSPGDSLRAGAVSLLRDDALREDAYCLTVEPDRLTIVAGGDRGAFYAVQTLRQLIPAAYFPNKRPVRRSGWRFRRCASTMRRHWPIAG